MNQIPQSVGPIEKALGRLGNAVSDARNITREIETAFASVLRPEYEVKADRPCTAPNLPTESRITQVINDLAAGLEANTSDQNELIKRSEA